MHTYKHTYIHTCTYMCTCTYICRYALTYVHIHMHMYVHAHQSDTDVEIGNRFWPILGDFHEIGNRFWILFNTDFGTCATHASCARAHNTHMNQKSVFNHGREQSEDEASSDLWLLYTSEPPSKRPRTEIWEAFAEIMEESGSSLSAEDDEIERYLSEPIIDSQK